eukprot:maker-scaffold_37-snap-gene-2.9-mRNA-1 protein AED:0.23 eAED:0.23 QI:165/1/1/1/1/1/5/70/323
MNETLTTSARFNALIPWIEKTIKRKYDPEFIGSLHEGVLLISILNSFLPFHEKIVPAVDVLNNKRSQAENIKKFLLKARKLGVDQEHLFDPELLKDNPNPSQEELDEVANTLEALQALKLQRGSPEKQNKWTKTAAETRAGQNKVTRNWKESNHQVGDLTDAIRGFTERTNQDKDLRYKKEGQQKWGLFETNYQRSKGITTEESLKEIEEFTETGKLPTAAPKVKKTVGGNFRNVLERNLNKEEETVKPGNAKKTGFQSGGNVVNGRKTKGGVMMGKVNVGQSSLVNQPNMGGQGGAAFFEKFNENEQRKYKPGSENLHKKLW